MQTSKQSQKTPRRFPLLLAASVLVTISTPGNASAHVGLHSYKLSDLSTQDQAKYCHSGVFAFGGCAAQTQDFSGACNWKHPGIGAYFKNINPSLGVKHGECWDDWFSANPWH